MSTLSVSSRFFHRDSGCDDILTGGLPASQGRPGEQQGTENSRQAAQDNLEKWCKVNAVLLLASSHSTDEHHFALVPIDCPT